jgi:triosephosphate isomerase
MKKTLIIANWKMNLNTHEASTLLHRYQMHIGQHRDIEVAVAPSMLSLQPLSQQIDRRRFKLCAQDAYFKDDGPYTGEVSFAMIRGLADYSIIGHSARRIYFGESLEVVRDKLTAAVRNGITPVLCIGETKDERNAGETKQVIHDHLVSALSNITSDDIEDIVIAYEPIWAISTFDGEKSNPEDMRKAMEYIRFQVKELYGPRASENVRVIYGGSVDDHDARAYLEIPGCDGALVGAASLNWAKFTKIVDTAYQLKRVNR